MPTLQTRKDNQHENICEEILRERAAVLSRAGIALEDAIDRLMSVDREIETKISLLKSYGTAARDRDILNKQKLLHEEINLHIDQFNDLCRNAQLKFYYLIVTREAMGLRRHEMVKQIYRIPSIKKRIQAI
jgi:ketopantoate reductase